VTAPGGFSVLLAKPELPPADKVAQVLASFKGETAFDARQRAKHTWGFLWEYLDQAEAERLAGLSTAAGLEARAVPMDRVARLPPGPPVHWLRAAPEGIFYTTGSDTAEKACPWDQVRLVAAAGLKEQISFTKTVKEGPSDKERMIGLGITMITGIPVGMGKSKEVKKTVQTTELFLHMDVFIQGPQGPVRLPVNAEQFNYSALGEARANNVFGNFRLLLQHVDSHAGSVLRNKGARTLMAGQPVTAAGYEGRADYEKEARWLLTLPL
jgi:hypothetical protein